MSTPDESPSATHTVRIAAVGDLHCTRTSQGQLQPLFRQAAAVADILVLCGDLVDYGLLEEAHILVEELAPALKAKLPILGVLGNHDFEAGRPDEVRDLLCTAGVTMLDGESVEVRGIGFAGAKGFAGGFGRRALEPWGEAAIKAFVRESIEESLKLESALGRLRTRQRIALLHYAPVVDTVAGEPPEIYPFLGSSHLEGPVDRHQVVAVLHGHAHRGTLEGRTAGGIPVYNVALPLLRAHFPDRPGFRILELQVDAAGGADGHATDEAPAKEAISSRL